MSATQLLVELTGQGVQLWAEGEKLRARAPEGVLTDEVRRRLSEHKEALLALLLRRGEASGSRLVPDPQRRGEPFPLTDIQQAYLAGRGGAYALGRVACHAYFELESRGLDLARLEEAWNRLIERHGMLRALVLPDGTQQILEQVPAYRFAVEDLRGRGPKETAARLEAVREELSTQVREADRWPLFEIRVSFFDGADGDRLRLHVSLDMLVLDAAGIFSVFSEWSELYRDPAAAAPAPELSFRDCVLAELAGRESEEYARAERYWLDRLPGLPGPPEPPFAKSPAEVERPRFRRRAAGLDAERWARFKSRAALAGLTPSGAVCAAYAEVLAAWSKNRRFLLTVPLFLRPPGDPEVERVLGDFTSTVLLEVEDAPGGFEARALRLQERLAEDLENARMSGVQVLRELQRRGDLADDAPAAVFTSLLGHRAFRDGGPPPTAWLGELVWGITQTPQVWLDHHVFEENGALLFNWDVVEELLPDGALDAVWTAYRGLLERLADEESAWADRPLLTPAEQIALYTEANATQAAVPEGLLQAPFERRVLEHQDAPAVVTADLTLTYRELWQQANALAWKLRELGARPNRLIAVVMEKGWEQVAGVLGVLGSGAAYLPISPDLPTERLCWLLRHGEVELALTQPRLDSKLDWPDGVRRLCVEHATDLPERPAPPVVQGPQDIAYVIYTSGSTGMPKGVVIDHRGALNTVADVNQRFSVRSEDRVLALSSLSFDLSVYDVFGLLAAGGAIVMPEPWAGRDPAQWLEWLRQERVTVWNTVPTLMEMLVEYAAGRGESLPDSLRLVMMSGDWIPLTLPDRIRALAPQARVTSLGGATEASIWSILYPIERVEEGWRSVPYGRAMVNQSFHVLDDALEPRPVWVPGPLYIGGIGLAQGYWRDEERTWASFVTHPRTGERLYRTGDLGRWLPDGNIEFLGREDFQVKVQGHRIELGEIEAALLRHAEVRAAVVTVAGDPRGARRLVTYVVGSVPGHPNAAELRDFLAARLPEAMLPSEIVHLEALPLTANGKVDRRALPAPGAEPAEERPAFAPPRNALERQLATIWSDVLGLEAVGVHDDFLRLGGNSLMAIRLYTRLHREMGVDLPLRTLLRAGTVARLAEAVAELAAGEPRHEEPLPAIVPDPEGRHEPFPLTDIQQAYWVGRSGAFELGNVAPHSYMELDGAGLDLDRFQAAWGRLIERHGMLRALVLPDGTQQVLEQVPDYEIEVLDLRGRDPEEAGRELAAVRERMSHQVLAVDRWPLFEIRASRLEGDRVRLHISLDLLVGDAWSMVRLVRELTELYETPDAVLPALELSFRDYVMAWQELERSALYERSLEYWRRRLPDLPPAPDVPLVRDPATLDRPRFVRRSASLEPAAWAGLQERAARAGLTPSSLLLAAFAEVLTGWSKSPRFTLNTTLFNRLPLHPQVEEVVGDFTSMILVEIDNSGTGPFAERARRVQERLWEDLDHRYVSGVRVLRELARLRGEGPRAAMPVVFTSTLIEGNAGDRSGLQWFRLGEPVYSVSQTPQVWLDHQIFEERGALLFNWDAVEELFPDGSLDAMWAAYRGLLERLADEAAWAGRPLLTPAEQIALQAEANATAAAVPEGLLQAPFERRVLERPDAPAVVSADLTLTYRELWQQANALAWKLRELGARPNRLIAVVMEKGWEQVAGVLGVLGSGAAYLPISPDLPTERLCWLLRHGEVELALTQPRLDAALDWPDGVRRLCVERAADAGERPAIPVVQGPQDIAYVIYTSGSTGMPKGVVIDHRGVLNTIVDVNQRFGVGPEDRVLALSSLSFDLSVYDVFGLLAAGGTIVMPEPWAGRDPAQWLEWLCREQVTVWNTVPTLMEMLVEHAAGRGESLPESLRLVMMSGDWIPLTLPDRIRALAPRARVISLGGATEASIWSILYPIERVEEGWRSVPYGRAMVNQSFHVLDDALEPRPVWVPGPLYIGGIGLAQGYWRDEERTRASFVTHPRTGERLYRAGDLGRWLPDGHIEFLGREDFQVKVQGHRIELGEIEAALLRHAEVRAAVVTVAGDPRGARHLVAYVVRERPAAPAPAPPAGAAAPDPAGEAPGFGDGVLNDPVDRLELKLRKPHLRRLSANGGTVRLARPEPEAASAWIARRSHRAFRAEPIPLAAFGRFLSCLGPLEVDGLPKYRYASAGSLYPVQVYLHVQPGRIEGVAGGTYYHHPVENALIPLARGAELDAGIHAPVNRPAFDGAAFSVFLIGQLDAIAPLYGSLSRDFCLLEAGGISHLLMTAAAENGLGLCPIGGYDFERVRGLLALEEGHIPLHSLVGGPVDAAVASLAVRPAASTAEASPLFADALREHLASRLPEYMVPSTFIELDALPLTANGKVDRRRLPDPEETAAEERTEPVAPRNELERRLAELLREVLGVERVGVLDGFFQLGANSVHMVQLNNRLRSALGRDLSIVDMFRFSNVATLAAHLATLPEEAGGPPSLARAESRAEARREEMARRRGARRRDARGDSNE